MRNKRIDFSFTSSPFKPLISFHKIIQSFEEMASSEIDFQAKYAQALLNEIYKFPELIEGIDNAQKLQEYEPIIKTLVADLFPLSLTHNEIKAVTIPFHWHTFNHTQRFKKILEEAEENFDFNLRDFSAEHFYILNCCVILKEFYGFQIDASDSPLFLDIPDKNKVMRHYRVLFNSDFIEVLPTDQAIQLTHDDILQLIDNFSNVELWKSKFPEQSWILKGFSIMTLFDATIENAVSSFKTNLLQDDSLNQFSEIESIFKSIYKISDLRIGITIFGNARRDFDLRVMGKQLYSHLLFNSTIEECENLLCNDMLENIVSSNALLVVSDIDQFNVSNPHQERFIDKLKEQNVKSFIFVPLVDGERFFGLLEMSSPRARELNSVNANKLNFVLPFIKDKVSKAFSETENQIEAIIQKEYTSIHPSVKWRFQEEALRYLNNKAIGKDYVLQEVTFHQIYPLYGQIDVQGSSESRNRAIQKDLIHQTTDLIHLFEKISKTHQLPLFEQKIFDLKSHLESIKLFVTTNTEQMIQTHFETDIHPLLENFRTNNSDAKVRKEIDTYFEKINHLNSEGYYLERTKFDDSITLINKELARLLDEKQIEAQRYFPHYYERYKTDGIEHNMYIGSSIAPDKKFELYYLQNLRLWQMQVMCEMENYFYQLQPNLPHELEVSSLILVFGTPISIRFKMDEKQFDIDGSYNVRYEIAKKRIDKAKIKDSNERLTQKGKLTIVYSQPQERKEYLGYINLLQYKGLLDSNIEYLEVEDLQGIIGLKALRVGVIYHEDHPKAYPDYSMLNFK